jgi:hypothetical protein
MSAQFRAPVSGRRFSISVARRQRVGSKPSENGSNFTAHIKLFRSVGNALPMPDFSSLGCSNLFDRPILMGEADNQVTEEAIGGEAERAEADDADEDLVGRHPQARVEDQKT